MKANQRNAKKIYLTLVEALQTKHGEEINTMDVTEALLQLASVVCGNILTQMPKEMQPIGKAALLSTLSDQLDKYVNDPTPGLIRVDDAIDV